MKDELSIKELCEKLWILEEELNLLDFEIKGVRIWELLRFRVFSELSKELCGYSQAQTEMNSFKDKLLNVIGLIKNAVTRNPFKRNYTVDFLLFDHPRKINVNGKNIDIYTDKFIESQSERKFDVIESPYLWKHNTSNVRRNRKYTDHEILRIYMMKKINCFKLTDKELRIIEEIKSEIQSRFGNVSIELQKMTIKYLENFIYKINYYKKLFRKRKPKKIFVVVSYSNIPIIAAAKDLGIEVIEFQHGVITDYHFAYNFSDPTKKLKYFPDKLLTFGEYWGKTKGFPKQTEIEVYGFPYLNQQLKKYNNTPKKSKQVLFLSQGTIGKQLSIQARKIAETMPEYYFVYKLHPGEYDRWKNEYPDLVIASQLENFEVIDNNEKNLYSFFAESEFQIGVYSTSIFEGLTLNCKTILLNLPGIEYMEDLIKHEIVEVANTSDEVKNIIKKYKTKQFYSDYFFIH